MCEAGLGMGSKNQALVKNQFPVVQCFGIVCLLVYFTSTIIG